MLRGKQASWPSTVPGMRYLKPALCIPSPWGTICVSGARTNRTNQSHFFLVIQHPSSDRPAVIILQPLLLKLQGNLSTSVAIVLLSFPYHHLPLYRFLMPAEPAQPAVTAATATTKAKHGHAASTAQPAPRKVRFNVGEKVKCLRI